jgi:Integrase core domain
VPAAKRSRADRKAGPSLARKEAAGRSEQGSVGGRVPRPLSTAPEDRQLVAQHDDLKLPLTTTTGEHADDAAQKPIQHTRQHDAQSEHARPRPPTRRPGRNRISLPHTFQAPTANAQLERWVGTIRRECLDRLLILCRRQLAHVLRVYVCHYNHHRPHRALCLRPPEPIGSASARGDPTDVATAIRRRDLLGGSSTSTKPRRENEHVHPTGSRDPPTVRRGGIAMSADSLHFAGVVLLTVPAIAFGGARLLTMIFRREPGYLDNPVRQNLWRAGHAHAGVLVILTLVGLLLVDQADLSSGLQWLVRYALVAGPILMPLGFFLSVASPRAEKPNRLIYLVPLGGLALSVGAVTLGVGILSA